LEIPEGRRRQRILAGAGNLARAHSHCPAAPAPRRHLVAGGGDAEPEPGAGGPAYRGKGADRPETAALRARYAEDGPGDRSGRHQISADAGDRPRPRRTVRGSKGGAADRRSGAPRRRDARAFGSHLERPVAASLGYSWAAPD